jgi:glycosyltransferase involved in cell wall biosynthesis
VGAFLDAGRFDGVHAHLLTYPWTPRRSEWLVGAFVERGLPFVDQAHGGDPERKARVCLDLMARTPLLIADSFYVRERLERLARSAGEEGSLPPIEVLPPAIVSFDAFRPDPDRRRAVRESLGISGGEVLIFFPSRFFDIDGTLSTRKRPLAALHAFAELVQRGDGAARLLAVLPPGFWTADSEEGARQGVRDLLEELGIAGRTVLLNRRVEHGDMADLFKAADVTIVPSVEGFGLVYLESMACGAPVVGLAEGASLEVVGDAGILVEPGPGDEERLAEALAGLVADGPRRLELGRRSRSRAAALYPPEPWAGRLEAVLAEAFARQAERRAQLTESV